MAVGQGSLEGLFSYLSIGRETTFGTAVTATAGLEFLSAAPKIAQENKVLEQITTRRVQRSNGFIKMGVVVEGEAEAYFFSNNTACNYLLQNAMGGAIASATATGETIGGLAFEHIYDIGNITEQTNNAMTFNMRKGDSAAAKVFEYTGMRVNEITFTAEIDEALKFSTSLLGKDYTSTATDLSTNITLNTSSGLSFVNGRISIENSFASLTSSSFWHVQSVALNIGNNLKGDTESRRIGTNTLDVLPSGVATIGLTLGLRFDTTTAIDALRSATQLSCELDFRGDTIGTSLIREGIKFQMPTIFINEAGDPEVSGPDGQLTSEVVFNVLHDESSATGYALKASVFNSTANYN